LAPAGKIARDRGRGRSRAGRKPHFYSFCIRALSAGRWSAVAPAALPCV